MHDRRWKFVDDTIIRTEVNNRERGKNTVLINRQRLPIGYNYIFMKHKIIDTPSYGSRKYSYILLCFLNFQS